MPAPKSPTVSPVFVAAEFNSLVADQGIKLVHYRALRCPVGMRDQYTERKTHIDHQGCSNGNIYERAGEMTCLFTGNGTSIREMDLGLMVGSTVQVTFPELYDDSNEPCRIANHDRIFLAEPQGDVVTTQLFNASEESSEKLRYIPTTIETLYDSAGNHYPKAAYEIRTGLLHWTGSRRPAPGQVCSVRYRYLPYWYVQHIVHEIRVVQVQDQATMERKPERIPYSAVLVRENIFELEQNDPLAPKTARQPIAPVATGDLFGKR
jgi:hypothetical protein